MPARIYWQEEFVADVHAVFDRVMRMYGNKHPLYLDASRLKRCFDQRLQELHDEEEVSRRRAQRHWNRKMEDMGTCLWQESDESDGDGEEADGDLRSIPADESEDPDDDTEGVVM